MKSNKSIYGKYWHNKWLELEETENNLNIISSQENEANAKLIACAHEMLEMLIDIKDYLGSDKRQEIEQLIKKATL